MSQILIDVVKTFQVHVKESSISWWFIKCHEGHKLYPINSLIFFFLNILPSLYWISRSWYDPRHLNSFSWSYWRQHQVAHLSFLREIWPQTEKHRNRAAIARLWWNSLWPLTNWGLWHLRGLRGFSGGAEK